MVGTALLGWSTAGSARLVRVEVSTTTPGPVAGYELVFGRYFGELDPADPANRIITDVASALRNARGRMEYSATFRLARPTDPAKRSGVLLYDVPNRSRIITGLLRYGGSDGSDPGGHVWVSSGW